MDNRLVIPSVDQIMSDFSSSTWLKNALQAALLRDPIDAANDAEILFLVLADKVNLPPLRRARIPQSDV